MIVTVARQIETCVRCKAFLTRQRLDGEPVCVDCHKADRTWVLMVYDLERKLSGEAS